MNKIKLLIIALISTFAFSSCSEDAPAKMMWEVSAIPSDNVKAAFDPSFYHQIQITANRDGGEVTLNCTNYRTLDLIGIQNDKGEYEDVECNFTAKVTESGVVKIILNKMPDDFKETKTFLQINGNEGKDHNSTTVDIIRKP